MGRLGISYEQVTEAADEILAAGSVPTIEKIRFKLGGTGSNSTINRHLNDWKKFRLQSSSQVSNHAELPDTLQRSIAETWEKIRNESQGENERIRKEADELITAAEQRKEMAESRMQILEETFEKIKIENNHLQADLKIKKEELEKERKQVTIFTERAYQYEVKLQDLREETEKRIQELERFYQDKVKMLQQTLENQDKRFKEDLNEMKELAESQRHQHITIIEQLKVDKNKVEKNYLKTEVELHHCMQKINELDTIKNDLNRSLIIKDQQLDEKAQQYGKLQREVTDLKAELRQKELLNADIKQNTHFIQQKFENSLEQIAQLKAENAFLKKELSQKETQA